MKHLPSSTVLLLVTLVFAGGLLPGCGDDEEPVKPVPKAAAAEGLGFAYVDVAQAMGYTLRNRTGKDRQKDIILEAMPPGIAVGDFDGDGWMDMYCPNGNRVARYDIERKRPVLLSAEESPRNALYWNREGKRFEDGAAAAGVDDTSWSFGAVAGDIDNDGDTDLYLCNWGANRLYLNDGTGKFEDVAATTGAAGGPRDWSSGACLFDYDNDGDLDIYIAQYADVDEMFQRPDIVKVAADGSFNGRVCEWRKLAVYCGPTGLRPLNDVFLHNDLVETGKLRFRDVTKAAGIWREHDEKSATEQSAGPWYGFQPVAWDIDGNGFMDVVVANDSVPNAAWMNQGNGKFIDQAEEMSFAVSMDDYQPQASMGVNIADINHDGIQDLIMSEFSHDQFNLLMGVRLPDGRVVFEEKSERTQLRNLTFLALGWGSMLFDADLDGDTDIFFACGHVYPAVDQFVGQETTYEQYNLLILTESTKPIRFRDATAIAGPGIANVRKASRAAVAIDFDNDGDTDIATSELNDTPCLLRCDIDRKPGQRQWIGLRLRGNPAKKVPLDPAGTVVTVVTGKTRQTKVFLLGSSFQSSEDPRMIFGLGDASQADRVEIRWPNGDQTILEPLAAGQVHEVSLK